MLVHLLSKPASKYFLTQIQCALPRMKGTEGFRQSVTQTQQAFASMAHDVSNSSETLTSTLGETITEMKQSGEEF